MHPLRLVGQVIFVVAMTAAIGLGIALYFYWVNRTKGAIPGVNTLLYLKQYLFQLVYWCTCMLAHIRIQQMHPAVEQEKQRRKENASAAKTREVCVPGLA